MAVSLIAPIFGDRWRGRLPDRDSQIRTVVFRIKPQCRKYGLSRGKANDNHELPLLVLRRSNSFLLPPPREARRSMVAILHRKSVARAGFRSFEDDAGDRFSALLLPRVLVRRVPQAIRPVQCSYALLVTQVGSTSADRTPPGGADPRSVGYVSSPRNELLGFINTSRVAS